MESMTSARRRRWFRFGLRTMFALMGVACCLLGVWRVRDCLPRIDYWTDYLPGTVRITDVGTVRGTGTLRYSYPNGSIKAEQVFYHGLVTLETWYGPDGSVLVSSSFDTKRGGDGHFFRDDGTIERRLHYKYRSDEYGEGYHPDGIAVFYKTDGAVDHEENYRDGIKIK